jgi:TonB family protein
MAYSIYATIKPHGVNAKRKHASHASRGLLPSIKRVIYGVLAGVFLCSAPLWAQTPAGANDNKAQSSRAYNPVYPYEALVAGRGGWAEISYTVDYTGRAILPCTVAASDASFASAFQADIEAIEYIPPRRNGSPMMSQAKERFDFPAQPALDVVAKGILVELRKPKSDIYTVADLDKKPEPIRQPKPAYPWILRSDGVSGEAEVEFVIDRNGRPLFPRIVSATQTDFGWAAATAVQRWRYQPPLKNGAKVDVRITEKVVFDIIKTADMW